MRYNLRLVSTGNRETLGRRLANAGVTSSGIEIMADKTQVFALRVDGVRAEAANIIKQQLLSIGGDAAVHRDVISGRPESSTVYLIADPARFIRFADKLEGQPFSLDELGEEVRRLVALKKSPPRQIRIPSGTIDLLNGPVIMGVLNLTPDSFSDGGLYTDPEAAMERALMMIEEGASIIDIGGESTRPGATELDPSEELSRVIPVLRRISKKVSVPISVDTRKASVAEAAMDAGASIINDISALRHDGEMIRLAVRTRAAVVAMHMRGTPATMQNKPEYSDPVQEIIRYLDERTGDLISAGIEKEKIIIDPGIGFGKRLEDNLDIIDQAGDFHTLGFPVLIGYSRKSFLGAITGQPENKRIEGGLAVLGKSLAAGIQIIRTHDVRETTDFIRVWKAITRKDDAS
ncbi:MAG: dihydropteroate synthase [Candidatus Krumholzibacteriota bacterium]|nr:dihydropteroate synthase [Candidatus Krumholzibacteriota bacterium]